MDNQWESVLQNFMITCGIVGVIISMVQCTSNVMERDHIENMARCNEIKTDLEHIKIENDILRSLIQNKIDIKGTTNE